VTQVFEGRRVFEKPDRRGKPGGRAAQHPPRSCGGSGTASTRVYDAFPVLKERPAQSVGAYLSGGEQQMLVIGRALMSDPKVILLDEPSAGSGAAARRGDLRHRPAGLPRTSANLTVLLGRAERSTGARPSPTTAM